MMKCVPVCKNTTRNHEQDAEEESSASEGERETVGKSTGKEAVGKPTGKTPDTQDVWNVTETITEKRTMEEIHQVHGNKSHDACQRRDMK